MSKIQLREIAFVSALALVGCFTDRCVCAQSSDERNETECRELWADWLESDYPSAERTSTSTAVVVMVDRARVDASHTNFCASYRRCCPTLSETPDTGASDAPDAPDAFDVGIESCDPRRPYTCTDAG